MNTFKTSLIATLAFGVISLPAQAGSVYVGTPLYKGTEIDGTPWEWSGTNWTESVAKQKGADLLCKGMGHEYATEYNTEKGQQKGTWRYHLNGTLEWCDFCQWYITELSCYSKRK